MKLLTQFKYASIILTMFIAILIGNLALADNIQSGLNGNIETEADNNKRSGNIVKNSLQVVGWVENIKVNNLNGYVKAKFDTGAKTSSIDATIIKTFQQPDAEHVLFRLNLKDNTEVIDSKIIRWTRIKTKASKYVRRPVIEMEFCIGNKLIKNEVNLAHRQHFVYPVLIGRNMIENNFLINAAAQFTYDKPKCQAK